MELEAKETEPVISPDAAVGSAAAPRPSKSKSLDPLRHLVHGTARELARNAGSLFVGASAHVIEQAEARKAFGEHGDGTDFAARTDAHQLFMFILNGNGKPVRSVRLDSAGGWTERDVLIARVLIRVFNGDLGAAPRHGRHGDVWSSLQQTRMARIIARLTTFNTNLFMRSLRVIEGARELTYEGTAFATRLLLTKTLKNVAAPAGRRFVHLGRPLPLGSAMLGEKWVRALTMDGSVALVVLAQRQLVAGVVVLSEDVLSTSASLHSGFGDLEGLVVDGVALIVATQHGDIWVRLSNRMTFLRRRSRWQYLDLAPIETMIARHCEPLVAVAILRMALDASSDRRGALFAVVTDPGHVSELVPDHGQNGRSNRTLRDMLAGLDILEPAHAALLRSAASVDGAMVFTSQGKVADGACMVVGPPPERIQALNLKHLKSYPGARSTAARNCSVYGVAIKVSHDGPISIFEGGRLKLELG